jgi:hypothetical protein
MRHTKKREKVKTELNTKYAMKEYDNVNKGKKSQYKRRHVENKCNEK